MVWQTQSKDQPLFPDMLWSRPQNKRQAGKLLIIGGHGQQFARVAQAYQTSQEAGAGTVKIILPDSLRKVAESIPNVQFAPSNPIGSFAKNALAELLDGSQWADAVLLAGDLGKNSETTAMLDSFLIKSDKLTVISNDSLQSIGLSLKEIADTGETDLVLDFKNLQRLGSSLKLEKPFISTMVNNVLAERLSELSKMVRSNMVIQREGQCWVASQGKVTNTKYSSDIGRLAAYCAVWHMQNTGKPLEAMTTACMQTFYK